MIVLKRTTVGKKNKDLRKKGLVPGVIYGLDTNFLVQIPLENLQKNLQESGHTGVIRTEFDGKKYNLMIDEIQINPVKRIPTHVTFRNVDLKEEIEATLPVEYENTDDCKGVKEDGGIIITNISEIEIKSLPGKIPSHLSIDVKDLRLGDVIKVEDFKLPEGVKFATEDENVLGQVAVTVTHKQAEETEEIPAATETVPVTGSKEKKEETTSEEK